MVTELALRRSVASDFAYNVTMHRVLLVFVAVGALTGTARAETADEYFEQGRKALADGNAESACDLFTKAIRLDPTAAGTMLNLGLCNEKLGKSKTALYWFRKAQARAIEKQLPDHERAAHEHMTTLTKKVRTIKLAFGGPVPANTRVKLDGEEVRREEYDHAEIDDQPPAPAQHHVIEAVAPGMKLYRTEFDLPAATPGEEPPAAFGVNVELVPGENIIVVDRGAGRRHAALYLTIGGGVLWGATGVVAYLAKTNYDDNKVSNPGTANKWVDRAEIWGTGLFIAGGVAISTAAILYFTAPQKERIEQTVFVPTVSPDGFGFAATGRF
jgi:hypothetical protein